MHIFMGVPSFLCGSIITEDFALKRPGKQDAPEPGTSCRNDGPDFSDGVLTCRKPVLPGQERGADSGKMNEQERSCGSIRTAASEGVDKPLNGTIRKTIEA
jgi:hypothetical protein